MIGGNLRDNVLNTLGVIVLGVILILYVLWFLMYVVMYISICAAPCSVINDDDCDGIFLENQRICSHHDKLNYIYIMARNWSRTLAINSAAAAVNVIIILSDYCKDDIWQWWN